MKARRKGATTMRERQMRRKYAKAKERARKHLYNKIEAMEMLLSAHGCRWENHLKCFIVQDFHPTTGISMKTRFLDIDGNEIPNPRDFYSENSPANNAFLANMGASVNFNYQKRFKDYLKG